MEKLFFVKMKWSWMGYQVKTTLYQEESGSKKYPASSVSTRTVPLQNPDYELYLAASTSQEAISEAKKAIKKSYFLRAGAKSSRRF
ncbi:hypothetical protein GCM10027275_26590 [Rhabdobacter roseus]|uniref:Uncharacterized protein n=1 Tax=Rhabdobacter roseus TaxID=1655419 RepID=A0A840TK78_9BACT|nr:hypothetical protein [Rhabdobacter roseus]MBB5284606.1 hypothetical protein [Rhabdobacter roseus]